MVGWITKDVNMRGDILVLQTMQNSVQQIWYEKLISYYAQTIYFNQLIN